MHRHLISLSALASLYLKRDRCDYPKIHTCNLEPGRLESRSKAKITVQVQKPEKRRTQHEKRGNGPKTYRERAKKASREEFLRISSEDACGILWRQVSLRCLAVLPISEAPQFRRAAWQRAKGSAVAVAEVCRKLCLLGSKRLVSPKVKQILPCKVFAHPRAPGHPGAAAGRLCDGRPQERKQPQGCKGCANHDGVAGCAWRQGVVEKLRTTN